MKNLILLICFAFGMLLTMPPGNQAYAADTHQITLVSDVGYAMPAYVVDQVDYLVALPSVTQFRVYDLAADDVPIFFIAETRQKQPDFNLFYCLNYRTCRFTKDNVNSHNKTLMQEIAMVHRFARDGLTQV